MHIDAGGGFEGEGSHRAIPCSPVGRSDVDVASRFSESELDHLDICSALSSSWLSMGDLKVFVESDAED